MVGLKLCGAIALLFVGVIFADGGFAPAIGVVCGLLAGVLMTRLTAGMKEGN